MFELLRTLIIISVSFRIVILKKKSILLWMIIKSFDWFENCCWFKIFFFVIVTRLFCFLNLNEFFNTIDDDECVNFSIWSSFFDKFFWWRNNDLWRIFDWSIDFLFRWFVWILMNDAKTSSIDRCWRNFYCSNVLIILKKKFEFMKSSMILFVIFSKSIKFCK